jgi:hypothetical protein
VLAWAKVFREQIAPKLSTLELEKLYEGLQSDDPNLVQGSCFAFADDGCTAVGGCAILYGMVKANPNANSHNLKKRFWEIRQTKGDTLGIPERNEFLDWFDNQSRTTVRVGLSVVVLDELNKRTDRSKN